VAPARLVSGCLPVQAAATVNFVGLAVAGAAGWTFAVAIFVAVASKAGSVLWGRRSARRR
jgi:hypothetical protein